MQKGNNLWIIPFCIFIFEVMRRFLADSNRRTRFCRPLTKPLIQGTLLLAIFVSRLRLQRYDIFFNLQIFCYFFSHFFCIFFATVLWLVLHRLHGAVRTTAFTRIAIVLYALEILKDTYTYPYCTEAYDCNNYNLL